MMFDDENMKSVLVFDPGESTGWVCRHRDGSLSGGTCCKDHRDVVNIIELFEPDIVVFERFNLYPGMAKSMSWNSFYPCEVIGVIRYKCDLHKIPYIEQAPSVKKFAGELSEEWFEFKRYHAVTEHTKDAYQHLRYFERVGLKKFK